MSDEQVRRLEQIERKVNRLIGSVDRILEIVEKILHEGTGRKPGRITKELERHGEMLDQIMAQLRRPERGNGEGER